MADLIVVGRAGVLGRNEISLVCGSDPRGRRRIATQAQNPGPNEPHRMPTQMKDELGRMAQRFQDRVRAVTGVSDMPEVMMANRTSYLMRLAARCLFRVCQRVLTTDPGMGVIRHVDAGYEEAKEFARKTGVKVPMGK